MNKKTKKYINVYNDSDDPTYENWLALYACIFNKKLSISEALRIMGISNKPESKKKRGAIHEH